MSYVAHIAVHWRKEMEPGMSPIKELLLTITS